MPMPTTGPISINDAAIEFQTGSGPLSITSLYRGGGLVPNISQNLNVPTSGSISLTQLRGAQRGTSLAANVSGSDVSYNNGNSTSPATRSMSGSATANPSGGSNSYTYSWSVVSQSNLTNVSLANTNAKTVTVTATASINNIGTVTLRCTVSDGSSTVQPTGNVTFNYYNTA